MTNSIGQNPKVSVFGESHGEYIGVTIDNLPAGIQINIEEINSYLRRRRPGYDETSTPRKESDEFKIICGVFNDKTDGSPLTAICKNKNTLSKDYNPSIIRPSHADLGARIKFNGFNDYRGGGMFSGRLTAPLVFAGGIINPYLKNINNIEINSKILSINGESDEKKFDEIILNAKKNCDSVGGKIRITIKGVNSGLGNPMFDSIESVLSHYIFSIPAIKAVSFGKGMDFASSFGSDVNDELEYKNGKLEYLSNNNGGILGGITTGQDIVIDVAIKPTPTISKPQKTINIETKENVEYSFLGRHDPCIVKRVAVVLEAVAGLGISQFLV